jgi:hypothetical protein
MTEDKEHYLFTCLKMYRDVAMLKYGRDFNCLAIEEKAKQLGIIAKRAISYSDLLFSKRRHSGLLNNFHLSRLRTR